jgi:hypothetical protein
MFNACNVAVTLRRFSFASRVELTFSGHNMID